MVDTGPHMAERRDASLCEFSGRDFEELHEVLIKKYAGTELSVPELPEKKQGINKVKIETSI
jgi:hypothetical protein